MRELLAGAIGGLMLVAGAAETAHADRTMVVVIDATGSMTAVRGDGRTRFQAAIEDAADRVFAVATGEGLSGVAVYRFFGTGITQESLNPGDGTPFISAFDAQTLILGLAVTGQATPLAGSLCDTIDIARHSGTIPTTTTRFLEVYSDGAENNTNPAHACYGPFSVSGSPFDFGSWQYKVRDRAVNGTVAEPVPPAPAITITATLYHDESFAAFARGKSNPEAALSKTVFAQPSLLAATDADLFAALAQDTGGTFIEAIDTAPAVVMADLDGDFDVDRTDAIRLARRFGAPAIHAFDLNADNRIGFADYSVLVSRLGTGPNPAPDPYTPNGTIRCNGAITLDGKVIENGTLTIETVGACVIFLRNSLIVSGAAGIKVTGAASLIVDNTIVVGENAWLSGVGSVSLSAANSVFHGPRKLTGGFFYKNRGNNTFE